MKKKLFIFLISFITVFSLTGLYTKSIFARPRKQVVKSISIIGKSKVKKGKQYEFIALVKGKNLYNKSVTWSISKGGKNAQFTMKGSTKCKIKIGKPKKDAEFTLKAVSDQDKKFIKTMTIKITK